MPIERRPLRDQIRDQLLESMRTGLIEPGSDIDETGLAASLGVSRTPLREALVGLAATGEVTRITGKGFRFARLSATEFQELGPIIATLESLALRLSPPDELVALGEKLLTLAESFRDNQVAHSMLTQRDDEWHDLLLSACSNSHLLTLIGQVRNSFHRYEALIVSSTTYIARNAAEHAGIAQKLISGELDLAIEELHLNWRNGAVRLLQSAPATHLID